MTPPSPSPGQPLRVLMTADAVGGVWTYALDLCRALAAADVRVLLATMGDAPTESQRAEAAALRNVRLEVGRYKLEWMDDPWSDVAAAGEWLRDLAYDFGADLVHLNGYSQGRVSFGVPVISVAHSCCLSWWAAVKGEAEPWPAGWDRYRDEVTAGLDGADAVVAPTAWMLRQVERWYGPPRDARVIHNGRDAAGFAPGVKQPYVLSAGRMWDEAKNLAALAAAAGGLSWPVHVAGPTASPDGRAVEARNVHWLGRLGPADMARAMSHAAIYALPAKYEPFGLSALEAALGGCALVLGDIPSLREVWGDTAVFVDPMDPTALRLALERLIAEPHLRQDLARRAGERARRYTLARTAAAYLDLYHSLVHPTPVRAPHAVAL